ncbi:S-adenosylmethionine decarboxylase proenzyme [Arenicella chitinivorans]|uniref:S-adenosylmethionine decarboxylase proenzyme n=1 Tax=Arenicella chitinivorans TaxID=1329800 RepID=A0A918VQ03_9GAMM|nr:adenosylmethionine decarboxylase [Arenicella chitinivorans]GHA15738.1 S-adenosylmethionine decarboxylase proenzyme [Arenicella chitinivorans]
MTLETVNCATINAGAHVGTPDVACQPADQAWPTHNQTEIDPTVATDHFIVRNGVEFAGTHIILDLWGAKHLDDLQLMEQTLRKAVATAGATLLHIHLHHFTPNGGISGVAVLAESHISVHTWPEREFAAFDVFMCGDAQPEATIPVLRSAFKPSKINVSEHLRGANIDNIEPANDR